MDAWQHGIHIFRSALEIKDRTASLGTQIAHDYAGKDLVLIGILKGVFVFIGDLARQISLPLTVDFMRVESYESTTSSGTPRIVSDMTQSIEGKHVLVVEDIIDTGHTMEFLLRFLRAKGPASLRVCSLLSKPARRIVHVDIDYCGFEVPHQFIVGYGLDCCGLYRNLPFLGILHIGEMDG